MRIFSKLFLIIGLFCGNVLFGATATTVTSEYTTGVNDKKSCAVECPPMKKGYFSRIINFNYETGTTTCYVYDLQNPTKAIASVLNINNYCAKNLNNPNSTVPIDTNTGAVNSHLKSTHTNVNKLFSSTGTSTYLNLPQYMVAGLMADDEIINIPNSITNNELVLNKGYTISSGLTVGGSSNILDATSLTRIKDALAGSVTFVINFLSMSDEILMSFQVALFMFSVAMSLGLLLTQKGTKKASQIQDHEDFAEKILFGVVSILVFFLPLNKIATPSGDISQNGYQQLIRPLIYLGVETADKLAVTATNSYLKYKFSEVGLVATEELRSYENQKYSLEQQNTFFKDILKNSCETSYNTTELKGYTKLLASNYTYPPSEEIYTKGFGDDEKRAITFYTKKYMASEGLITSSNIPAVSFCYFAENSVVENNTALANLTAKINAYKGVSADANKKINLLTDLTYKNVAEFGFISIANLSTASIAFSNLELIEKDENLKNLSNPEKRIKEYREATGYEVGAIAQQRAFGTETMYNLLSSAPLYILPFASSVSDFIDKTLGSADNLIDTKNGGVDEDGKVKEVGWFKKLWGGAVNIVAGTAYGTFKIWLTETILKTIVSLAPLVAMVGASFLVMCFYFLSILILYIVIPFASIFAFSTGNLDIIRNLVKQTFILAVKPVLIVVSVLMAMFVHEMFISFNGVVIASMFDPLMAIANETSSASMWDTGKGMLSGLIFVFLKGLMLLMGSVITVFACFYLVFNGANVILDILGIRESGFDAGAVVGDKVEGKGSSSKTNTLGV